MGKKSIIDILVIVFAVLDAVVLIFGAVYLTVASKNIKSIQLTPDFSETEIGVNSEYTFTVSATPSKASLKKVELICSDPSMTFKMGKDGKATLVTGGAEGTVTVSAKYKKVESNTLTFQVVDLVARAQAEAEAAAAAAAAEAEAAEAEAAQAEAEAAAALVKEYVKMTGDNVNVRAENNTDCAVLGKAKKGEMFEKVEIVDDWTHIMYNGQDGYIKSEYLTSVTEEEFLGGSSTATTTATEEKKQDTQEEKKEDTEAAKKAAEEAAKKTAEEAAAKAAEEAAKKAEEEAKKAAEEAAAQQAAAQAAAAAAAAAGPTLECADGPHTFTQAQYNFLKGFWYRDGQTSADDWKVYAHKHTYAECVQICQIEGGL